MKISELFRQEAFVGANFAQNLARLEPVLHSGNQHRVISLKGPQELPFCRRRSTAPQFRNNYCGRSYESSYSLNSFPMASRTKLIDEDGCIKNDEATHQRLRNEVCPHFSSLDL